MILRSTGSWTSADTGADRFSDPPFESSSAVAQRSAFFALLPPQAISKSAARANGIACMVRVLCWNEGAMWSRMPVHEKAPAVQCIHAIAALRMFRRHAGAAARGGMPWYCPIISIHRCSSAVLLPCWIPRDRRRDQQKKPRPPAGASSLHSPLSSGEGPGIRPYTTPWSNIASATFTKPAIFAPFT